MSAHDYATQPLVSLYDADWETMLLFSTNDATPSAFLPWEHAEKEHASNGLAHSSTTRLVERSTLLSTPSHDYRQ